MRLTALVLLFVALAACSRSSDERAREQARQTADQLKHDSKQALDKTEAGVRKANRELTQDPDKARDEAHRALDDTSKPKQKDNPPQ